MDIPGVVSKCRAAFNNGKTRSAAQRKATLYKMLQMIDENTDAITAALKQDLGKCEQEARLTEVGVGRDEVIGAIENVESWMKPTKPSLHGVQHLDSCYIQNDPLGVILVISPWNFPWVLSINAIVGAIAAGNTVVFKPSEVAPHVATLFQKLFLKYIPTDIVAVVCGGVPEATVLLAQRFDHIMYTGNGTVARIIMAAAAKNLTPVTLELGGKSPVIVDEGVNFDTVARRVMWGRSLNSGQMCIAPDYILVKPQCKAQLIAALKKARTDFMGEDPEKCKDYSRMINDNHFKRVVSLLKDGKVVVGGETNPATKFIAPTVLDDVKLDSPLMTDEIFGPLLPLVPYNSVTDAINFVNARDKPLAMYIFSSNKQFVNTILNNTSAGGVTVNDTVMHISVHTMPFGGVGGSGIGAYHGKFSFDTFSHRKSVMVKTIGMEFANAVRYMPYNDTKRKILEFLLFKRNPANPMVRRIVLTAVAGAAIYYTYTTNLFNKL
jgi:aldehyde dehydrogenase (NAD+)